MRYIQNIKLMNETLNAGLSLANIPQSPGLPEEITLTATLRCNYRCAMCYQQEYKGDLDWRAIEKLAEILPFARTLQIFGGEPLLAPKLDELFALADQHSCQIHIITNASLLDARRRESLLERRVKLIKCSIDAGSPKTYAAIRGGDFFQVLGNIAKLHDEKSKRRLRDPKVHLQFLAMRSNIRELNRLVTIAKEIGVERVNVVYPDLRAKNLVARECVRAIPDINDAELLRAVDTGQKLGVYVSIPSLLKTERPEPLARGYERCSDPWRKLLVGVDGTVNLCCQNLPAVGNLLTQDFDTIWNSELVQRIRRTINTPDEFPACRACSLRRPAPMAQSAAKGVAA